MELRKVESNLHEYMIFWTVVSFIAFFLISIFGSFFVNGLIIKDKSFYWTGFTACCFSLLFIFSIIKRKLTEKKLGTIEKLIKTKGVLES